MTTNAYDAGSTAGEPPAGGQHAQRLASLRRFVAWSLIGAACGVAATLVVLAILARDPTPALTLERFEAAQEQWNRAGPPNYDIEVRVTGPQPAVYRVQVRDGQPQAAWRNGQPLSSRRTFGTWSVPGMFRTIARDFETVQRHAAGRGGQPLILKASFDPQYGFPVRYRRIDRGSPKGGDAIAVTWDVKQFTVN